MDTKINNGGEQQPVDEMQRYASEGGSQNDFISRNEAIKSFPNLSNSPIFEYSNITEYDLDLYKKAINGKGLSKEEIEKSHLYQRLSKLSESKLRAFEENHTVKEIKAMEKEIGEAYLRKLMDKYPDARALEGEAIAITVIGAPASGKSSSIKKILAEKGISENRIITLDSDDIKELIPGYDKGIGANAVHDLSSKIKNNILDWLTKNNYNVILPIVGANNHSLQEDYEKRFNDAKYKENILVLKNVRQDICLARNFKRMMETGRFVPTHVVENGEKAKRNFKEAQERGDYTGWSETIEFAD